MDMTIYDALLIRFEAQINCKKKYRYFSIILFSYGDLE